MVSGNKANKTGNVAETLIACMLKENGVPFKRHYSIGESIYGNPLTHDFVLTSAKIIIEIKWQQVGGSTDEKYPFLVANLKWQDGYRSIIVADGGGAKPNAIRWMIGQIDEQLIGVFSLSEFVKFVNDGCLK